MMLLHAALIAVEILSAVLLVAVILLQKPRGGGVGVAFGAGFGEAIFGPRMGNVLTRATMILAAVFLLNTLLLANLYSGRSQSSLMRRYGGGTRKGRIIPVQAAEPEGTTGSAAAVARPEGATGATGATTTAASLPEPGNAPPAPGAAENP